VRASKRVDSSKRSSAQKQSRSVNANRRFVVAQSARSSPRDAREFDARRNDFDDEVGPGSGGIWRYVFAFARAYGGGVDARDSASLGATSIDRELRARVSRSGR
jgi:hypothetical protein